MYNVCMYVFVNTFYINVNINVNVCMYVCIHVFVKCKCN